MLSFHLFSLLNRFLVLTKTHVRDFPIQLCVPVICNVKWRSHIHTVDSIENTTKEKKRIYCKITYIHRAIRFCCAPVQFERELFKDEN